MAYSQPVMDLDYLQSTTSTHAFQAVALLRTSMVADHGHIPGQHLVDGAGVQVNCWSLFLAAVLGRQKSVQDLDSWWQQLAQSVNSKERLKMRVHNTTGMR